MTSGDRVSYWQPSYPAGSTRLDATWVTDLGEGVSRLSVLLPSAERKARGSAAASGASPKLATTPSVPVNTAMPGCENTAQPAYIGRPKPSRAVTPVRTSR